MQTLYKQTLFSPLAVILMLSLTGAAACGVLWMMLDSRMDHLQEVMGQHTVSAQTPVATPASELLTLLGEARSLQDLAMAGSVFAVLLLPLAGWAFYSSRYSTALRRLKREVARSLNKAEARIDVAAYPRGEVTSLAEILKTLCNTQQTLINDFNEEAGITQGSCAEYMAINRSLRQHNQLQAQALMRMHDELGELKDSFVENGKKYTHARNIAEESQVHAQRGREVLRETIDAMSAISESSTQISEISNMIDSIAFETNLLALNAAVEAARAGDEGRGFAVVATEVRNLAQRSAGFAKEIKTLIEASVQRVHTGSQLVAESGSTLNTIMEANEEIAEVINFAHEAISAQNQHLSRVQESLEEMQLSSRQVETFIEDSTDVTWSLEQQTVRLEKLADRDSGSESMGDQVQRPQPAGDYAPPGRASSMA